MYVLKTKPLELSILSESKANNKSNDENRTRWLKEEKKRKKKPLTATGITGQANDFPQNMSTHQIMKTNATKEFH